MHPKVMVLDGPEHLADIYPDSTVKILGSATVAQAAAAMAKNTIASNRKRCIMPDDTLTLSGMLGPYVEYGKGKIKLLRNPPEDATTMQFWDMLGQCLATEWSVPVRRRF